MQIIIDLDGTICTEEKTFERALAKPKAGAVESVNHLFDQGHTIIIYTARGWQEFRVTQEWLERHGIRFHSLMMGKPIGDVWIDDRAIRFLGNWPHTIQQLSEISK